MSRRYSPSFRFVKMKELSRRKGVRWRFPEGPERVAWVEAGRVERSRREDEGEIERWRDVAAAVPRRARVDRNFIVASGRGAMRLCVVSCREEW